MNDDDKNHSFSRRRVLGGLGAIGIASAGAGLGTTAFFNDTEAFNNNSLEAGKLNLKIGYEWEAMDTFHLTQNGGDLPAGGVLDGQEDVRLVVDDVKPGDWGVLCLTVTVDDNPAYVRVTGELTEDAENSVPEPEFNHSYNATGVNNMEDDIPNQASYPSGSGELAEELMVAVGYGSYSGGPTGTFDSYEPGLGGSAGMSLRDMMDLLSTGVTLRGPDGHGNGTANATAVGNTTLHANADANDIVYCFKFWVPATVGNWIQTDSVMFDLGFEAEQMRHNEVPFGPDNTPA
ncbi:MAG: SipW-dependent-type signal peptide-containing protein [Haloferacaceae archaeon]